VGHHYDLDAGTGIEVVLDVAVLRSESAQARTNLDRLAAATLDHEKRLVRIETLLAGNVPPPPKQLRGS